MKEPENIQELIRKHFQGEEMNRDEQSLFLAWQNENEAAYSRYKNIWEQSGQLKLHLDVDVPQQWEIWKSNQQSSGKKTWYAAAAVISLLIISTLVLLNLNRPIVYSVDADSQPQLFTLEDSSQIWLNRNSTLTVANNFNETDRKVKLKGEGYFEVYPQKEKPFIVENEYSSITVLGTKFNTISNDSINAVQLLEGSVSFSSDSNETLTLVPGEQAIVSRDKEIIYNTIASNNFLSWKTGLLTFENETVKDLIIDLEKHYHVNISLANEQLGQCKVTITFDNLTLDEALGELSFLLDMDYSIHEDEILLNGEGCNE